jgi:uncharacterized protein (TIGR02145 family)
MKASVYSFLTIIIVIFLTGSCKKEADNSIVNQPTDTFSDIDGNVYHAVKIGEQVWMEENLAVTHYRNGDPVTHIADNDLWLGTDSGAYCNYNNDTNSVGTYGRLYNWYAVDDSRLLSPVGWHIPSDEEWKQLEMFLGMTTAHADSVTLRGTNEGGKLKETGNTHWNAPNKGATNSSGFTALPAGYRTFEFEFRNSYGAWWTASKASPDEAIYRSLTYDKSGIIRMYYMMDETTGLSVRCIKD